MIRLAVRAGAGDAERVNAALLELSPAGVERVDGDGFVEFAVYGAPGELPALPHGEAHVGGVKVLVRGESVPDGWIVDKDGKPTTDPRDFYDGGALLTIGAHKGSGLSIVTDLLAGAITTGKSSDPEDTVLRNNMLSIFIAPAVYDASGGVAHEAARFIEFVKASPPAKAGEPVKAPGDVERATRKQRLASGIPIDDTTWSDLATAAQSVGIDRDRASAMIA